MSNSARTIVASWEYRDIAARRITAPERETEQQNAMAPVLPGFTEQEVGQRIDAALATSRELWGVELRQELQQRDAKLATALAQFASQRVAYFKRAEEEVVQLALAIARKILLREAELDPTLLSGLVRIAMDRMGTETPGRVRIAPADAPHWEHISHAAKGAFEVMPDEALSSGECLLETSLGTANFGFEAQLKEIETSFLDLLAKRPEPK